MTAKFQNFKLNFFAVDKYILTTNESQQQQ